VFSPDGALLASGGEDRRILLWDVRKRKQIGKPFTVDAAVFSMVFSHNGKMFAIGDQSGGVDLWNVVTHSRKPLSHHLAAVYGVAFSPDDRQLASVSADQTVHIYNLERTKSEPQILTGNAGLFSVDFAGGGLVSGTNDGTVIFWDPSRPIPFGWQVQSPTARSIQALFTGDGNTLVSCSSDKLEFWPVEKAIGSPPTVSSNLRTSITRCVPAPNSKDLVVIGSDNSIELWDLTVPRPNRTILQPGKDSIVAAAYGPDSRTLALGVVDTKKQGEIWLLNMPDGKLRQVFGPWDARIMALAFSPKANLLAIAEENSTISVWDLDTLETTRTFKPGHAETYGRENVTSLVFSRDGKRLASGNDNGVVWLWDMESRRGFALEAHRASVRSVAFSFDGKLLASGSSDETVLLWDVATGEQLIPPLNVHGDSINSVGFTPDGRWLAATADNGSIGFWQMDMPTLLSRACEIAGRDFRDSEWKRFFGDDPFRVTCPGAAANDADALALSGDSAHAEELFDKAVRATIQTNQAHEANQVCWLGSLDGFATIVKPACERAVELAPETEKDNYQDSRGLARALSGDWGNAIQDFEAEVKSIRAQPDLGGNSEEVVRRREDWIAALKEGRNPFDKELLNLLRTE
jgi:WD40 repeat protein